MRTSPIPVNDRPGQAQDLATILLVIAASLPLMRFLDWQITAFLLLLFAVRLVAVRWRTALPGTWLRLLLTLAGVANCLYVYHTLAGQYGGAALFATMLALKLLELRSKRDLRLVVILIGFLIVIQFLFDQTFPLVVYLVAVTLGVVALLVDLNGGLGAPRIQATLRVTLSLALQALPLTLVLFLLFPRLSAPLWDLGLDDERAMTGMSDSMEPGAISELVVNGELAFRVRFDSPPPPENQLYWRGPVLWAMDGRRWTPGTDPADVRAAARLLESSDAIDYEVILEPTQRQWLFALDLPTMTPAQALLNADFTLLASAPVTSVKRYRMHSVLSYRTAEPNAAMRARALSLPENITPRMRTLVDAWKHRAKDPWSLVQQGLAHFNREDFHYTLLPPKLGANPADEFLFETRRGFCEHYASGFALLMRIGGIPSRIVLGYLGAERNHLGDYYMVWQSDAHAWVEVLIDGRGWVRVDPTAAVDPSRVDNRSAARILGAGTSVRFDLHQASQVAKFVKNLRLLADTLDATWQNWVLDFSVEDQFALLERVGLGELREYGLAVLMLLSISLTLGVILLALMRGRSTLDPLDALYALFCGRMARIGLARRRHEAPYDYARRIIHHRPDLTGPVSRFMALYVPARFGPDSKPASSEEIRRQLRAFHPKRRPSP